MLSNKLENLIIKYDHLLHIWSGIAHLLKFLFGFIFLIISSYWSIKNWFPDYKKILESHFWVFCGVIVWFIITLRLFFASLASRTQLRLLSRLGAACAENLKKRDYTYSEKRKIVKIYEDKFHKSDSLYILGASGYHTFSKPDDPREDLDRSALLRPILDKLSNDRARSSVNIDVLLLHPDSHYIIERTSKLEPKQTVEDYKKEILDSINFCKELKTKLPNLRCYVYNRPLIWKLIITDSFVWQQFYEEGTHAENSRINIFENIPQSGNALFHPFRKLFELLRDTGGQEVVV